MAQGSTRDLSKKSLGWRTQIFKERLQHTLSFASLRYVITSYCRFSYLMFNDPNSGTLQMDDDDILSVARSSAQVTGTMRRVLNK